MTDRKIKKYTADVAIIFDDMTEFFVMRMAIDALKKAGVKIHIIVPHDCSYFKGLAEHTLKGIKASGYEVLNDCPKDAHYKILMTPYRIPGIMSRAKCDYNFNYPYGLISPKPDPTYMPDYLMPYDVIFRFNNLEPEYLSAYGNKGVALPYWRFVDSKPVKKRGEKPTLLILPTFGDISCMDAFNNELTKKLQEQYFIIAKSHHASDFRPEEKTRLEKLKKTAHVFYDSDTPISDVLAMADIVLSDNSGALFEAMYAGIPVVSFAKENNSRRLGELNTLQYQLAAAGVLPFTSDPKKLPALLTNVKNKYFKKQQDFAKTAFVPVRPNPTKPFVETTLSYLKKDPSNDAHRILHAILTKEWNSLRQENAKQRDELEQIKVRLNHTQNILAAREKEVRDMLSSKSWKLTVPLRWANSKIKRGGKK